MHRRFAWNCGYILVVPGLIALGYLSPAAVSADESGGPSRLVTYACPLVAATGNTTSVAATYTGSHADFDDYLGGGAMNAPVLSIERIAGMANCASTTAVPAPHPELRCVGCFHETW